MKKRFTYLKADSRNRITLTRRSKHAGRFYKAHNKNGTLILEPVCSKDAKKHITPLKRKSRPSSKVTFTVLKIDTKGYTFDREEANAR